MIRNTKPDCLASHLGPWAIEPRYLSEALTHIRAGSWKMMRDDDVPLSMGERAERLIERNGSVAVVSLDGSLMKGISKFGGTSTLAARIALSRLGEDPDTESVVLRIDSPGGQVAGTAELGEAVAELNQVKPVHAYIEDMGASAAYWVASQARSITANKMALVGSIGVLFVMQDMSKAAEKDGVDVKVFATGPHKGTGTPGAPITDEQAESIQRMVDDFAAQFFGTVKKARGFNAAQLSAVTTGEVWIASRAKDLGLIDGIKTIDEVVGSLIVGRAPARSVSRAENLLALERAKDS